MFTCARDFKTKTFANREKEKRIHKVIGAELLEFCSVQKVATLVSQKEIDLFVSDVAQKVEAKIERTEK